MNVSLSTFCTENFLYSRKSALMRGAERFVVDLLFAERLMLDKERTRDKPWTA